MTRASKVRAAIGTYFRAYGVLFLAITVSAIFKAGLDSKTPDLWTSADLAILKNGIWIGLMAVAYRWLNKRDPVYGRGSAPSEPPVVEAYSVIPRAQ